MKFPSFNILTKQKLQHLDAEYFKDLEISIKNLLVKVSRNNKYLMTFSELYSSFSISKAEDSTLTLEEAVEIQKNNMNDKYCLEIKASVKNLNRLESTYDDKVKKFYNKLEFYNILRTYKYAVSDEFIKKITWNGLTIEILSQLHSLLTEWLDEIFLDKWIKNFSHYSSGKLRSSDNIRVGKNKPIQFNEITEEINKANKIFKNLNSLEDIADIHAILYHAHVFHNWNKRTNRILEAIFLKILWFQWILNPNIGYHYQKKEYIDVLVNSVVWKNDTIKMRDMLKSSIVLSWIYLVSRELNLTILDFLRSKKDIKIFSIFSNWIWSYSTKELIDYFKKTYWFWESAFYARLAEEKKIFKEMISETKDWKMNIYSLVDIDNKNSEKYRTLTFILDELIKQYSLYDAMVAERIKYLK